MGVFVELTSPTFNHTPVRRCQGKPLYINVANEDIQLMRAAKQPMPLLP